MITRILNNTLRRLNIYLHRKIAYPKEVKMNKVQRLLSQKKVRVIKK